MFSKSSLFSNVLLSLLCNVIIGTFFLAATTVAQPVLDGQAKLMGPVADILSSLAPVLTEESARSLVISYVNKPDSMPRTPEEKDFFAELASGAAVSVTLPGKTLIVPPLGPKPLKIVRLLNELPNLNTLWKQPGEPVLQMLEMSRWGDRGRKRITEYIANKLYSAWSRASLRNSYGPWIGEYNWLADSILAIEDPAVKTEAKLLLKSAIEQVFAKSKADGREVMPHFLYYWPLESVGVPNP